MRFLILIIFIFLSNFSSAQTKISIDGIFSFDNGFRSFPKKEDPRITAKEENEFKKNGHRFGLNFNFYPTKKIGFKTGIRWVKSGYGTDFPNSSFDYKFLEIPLIIRYYYGQNKLRLFTELGIGITQYRSGNVNPIAIMRKWHQVAIVGFGFDYDYSQELAFFLQPNLRYHLSNTFKSQDVPEENLYNFGVEIGFRLKF